MSTIKIKQVKSMVEHECTPSILGMVNKVKHLVAIVK